MLVYRCLARTYAERTYPKPADSVSAIKEKPSILSHISTDIWHRFKFQRPMFTTYWLQLFAFHNILNQLLHIWYSLAISFTTKYESQKSNYFWYFANCVKKVKVVRFLQLKLCFAENSEDLKCKETNWKVCKMQEVVRRMRYERNAITMLVYARNSIDTWHRLKFLRLSFTIINFTKMQRLAFRKIFNQFSHISYLLVISFTTKFELQKSNIFRTIFAVSISMRQKRKWFSLYPSPFLSVPLSLSLSLSFSLSLFAFNKLLCNI